MEATDPGGANRARRAREKLENDYRSSVVYFWAGPVILAAWAGLAASHSLGGPWADLRTSLLGIGILISGLGAGLIAINGWLLKRQDPTSPLPNVR